MTGFSFFKQERNERRRILFTALFIIMFATALPQAGAHEFKMATDSIGALLHSTPDDNPIVGEQARMYFAFEDKKHVFTVQRCLCMLKISLDGRVLSEETLGASSDRVFGDDVFAADFVFPKKGIYNLEVTGQARDQSFGNFSLQYDLRIERESEDDWLYYFFASVHTWHIFLTGGVIVLFSVLGMVKRFRRKRI